MAKKELTAEQKAAKEREKKEKFEELADVRVSAAIVKLRGVAKLANTKNYTYTAAYANRILGALNDEVTRVRDAFAGKTVETSVFNLKQ